ncbi:hypothetical protein vseg_019653 [Gypsophila vaccaria]
MASNNVQLKNPDEPNKPISVINFQNYLQLKDTLTYKQWSFQIRATINGYRLFHFLDGTTPAPPETLTIAATEPNGTLTTKTNPTLMTWYRQDQFILSALTGILSPTVAPFIARTTTSHEAWTVLSRTFANKSRGRKLQLKSRFHSLKLGDGTITEFMHAVKTITDDIAQLDRPMDIEDILTVIFDGLDSDLYGPVISVVKARDTPISFEDLHERLIQHEVIVNQSKKNNITLLTSRSHLPLMLLKTALSTTDHHTHLV